MIFVRKHNDNVFTALHLVPPTVKGLLQAVLNGQQENWESLNFKVRIFLDFHEIWYSAGEDIQGAEEKHKRVRPEIIMNFLSPIKQRIYETNLFEIARIKLEIQDLKSLSNKPIWHSSCVFHTNSKYIRGTPYFVKMGLLE